MLEKLVMTGGVRLLRVYAGGFFLANTVAIGVVTFMLCLLAARRPSKTDPYNTAMIVSHAVTLCMLLATIMLNFPTEGTADAWITPERIGFGLVVLQLPFWIFLIKVSFGNLKQQYKQAKLEAKAEAARKLKMKDRRRALGLGTLTVRAVCTRDFTPMGASVGLFAAEVSSGGQSRTTRDATCTGGTIGPGPPGAAKRP